jgi:hypothetical protein
MIDADYFFTTFAGWPNTPRVVGRAWLKYPKICQLESLNIGLTLSFCQMWGVGKPLDYSFSKSG